MINCTNCGTAVAHVYSPADSLAPARPIHEYTAQVVPVDHGDWIPANGGTETPTTYRDGKTLLYMWNRAAKHDEPTHAYYDCDNDIFLDTDTALRIVNGH